MNRSNAWIASLLAIALLGTMAPSGAALSDSETVSASGAFYADVDRSENQVAVWEETNGLQGLQTEETPTDEGDAIPADEKRATLSGPDALSELLEPQPAHEGSDECSHHDFVEELGCRAGAAIDDLIPDEIVEMPV